MSAIVKVTVQRTKDWVRARRLETGENVPETIEVEVLADQLPREVRELLIEAGGGSYPDEFAGDIRQDYLWMYRSDLRYGRVPIIVDADQPTPESIAAAILTADKERRRMKMEVEEKIRQREERERALAEEWARLPLEQRASAAGVCVARDPETGTMSAYGVQLYDISALKKYVPEALDEAVLEVERLREIERGREAIKHRALLAELLGLVPEDALRHAVKRAAIDGIAGKPASIEEVRKQVHQACQAGGVRISI
jgi:hypothetical protein